MKFVVIYDLKYKWTYVRSVVLCDVCWVIFGKKNGKWMETKFYFWNGQA